MVKLKWSTVTPCNSKRNSLHSFRWITFYFYWFMNNQAVFCIFNRITYEILCSCVGIQWFVMIIQKTTQIIRWVLTPNNWASPFWRRPIWKEDHRTHQWCIWKRLWNENFESVGWRVNSTNVTKEQDNPGSLVVILGKNMLSRTGLCTQGMWAWWTKIFCCYL